MMRYAVAFVLMSVLAGCGTRTITIEQGAVVQLRKTVRNWPVWVRDKDGIWTASRVDLEEGWHCGWLPPE